MSKMAIVLLAAALLAAACGGQPPAASPAAATAAPPPAATPTREAEPTPGPTPMPAERQGGEAVSGYGFRLTLGEGARWQASGVLDEEPDAGSGVVTGTLEEHSFVLIWAPGPLDPSAALEAGFQALSQEGVEIERGSEETFQAGELNVTAQPFVITSQEGQARGVAAAWACHDPERGFSLVVVGEGSGASGLVRSLVSRFQCQEG